MKWRWDQGRLDYFQFGEIQRIARALVAFDGHTLPRGEDPDLLRITLGNFSDRPFLPSNYKVWRNYKRVFGCQMLAIDLGGVVYATDLCKSVATGSLTVDEYLLHVATRFSYPSPVFENYEATRNPQYPVCAIIKYLVSEFITNAKPVISLTEIIDKVKGNELKGSEPLPAYAKLPSTGVRVSRADDEYRQIRELVRFFSQFTFLKWENPNLILDIGTADEARAIAGLMTPIKMAHQHEAAKELLALGGAVGGQEIPEFGQGSAINAYDQEFTEGSKLRVTHLRVERSAKLREFYFAHTHHPHVCDMCEMNTVKHYPWVTKLVELHHLLPLSSPIRVESEATSLKDLVGLCPSCHRAIHRYYSFWLKDQNKKDFESRKEAHDVYKLATNNFVSLCQQ